MRVLHLLFVVVFRFPKNEELAAKWKKALGIEIIQGYITGTVCVEHFTDFEFKRKNKKELKSDAIPHSTNDVLLINSAKNSATGTSISLGYVANEI